MNYDNITTTMDDSPQNGDEKSPMTRAERWFAKLPFIYLVIFLCAIYVFSAHQAEKKVRSIQHLQAELVEMKWEYTSLNADWMYSSTRSQVAERVAPADLKWTGRTPVIIEVGKNRGK